nr:P7 putative protein [Peach associated luteovirus]UVH29329.1 P7 putative protein [Peach associated luteovirus]UVH29334.1 P7 putative protein [Peach associated luteovirus]
MVVNLTQDAHLALPGGSYSSWLLSQISDCGFTEACCAITTCGAYTPHWF